MTNELNIENIIKRPSSENKFVTYLTKILPTKDTDT